MTTQFLTETVTTPVNYNCDVLVCGGGTDVIPLGAGTDHGAFFAPTLLLSRDPWRDAAVHDVEAFGPVSTLMPFDSMDEAVELAARGRGSLVASLVTRSPRIAAQVVPAMATAAASAHMRRRVQSPISRMSATAPMVQKLLRWAAAPNAAPIAKATQAMAGRARGVSMAGAGLSGSGWDRPGRRPRSRRGAGGRRRTGRRRDRRRWPGSRTR